MIVSIIRKGDPIASALKREYTTFFCALTYIENYRSVENNALLSFVGRRPRVVCLQKMVYRVHEGPLWRIQISPRERIWIFHNQLSQLYSIETGIFDFKITERRYFSESFRHAAIKRAIDECMFTEDELVHVDFNALLAHESPKGVEVLMNIFAVHPGNFILYR